MALTHHSIEIQTTRSPINDLEALERELACDELAMAGSGATAADYAQTLVEAASRSATSGEASVRFA